MAPDGNDRELIEAFVARRDERGFRALYQKHTAALYRFALRLVGGVGPDAEDVVQETWIRAVQSLDVYQGHSVFRTWLFGIAVNCSRELLRRRGFPNDPAEIAVPHAEAGDLARLIARLPEGCREVLVLHDIEGYTHEEIAGLLSIAPGTSKHHLFRAREKLREWFGVRKHDAK
jgi:RNA polymerase sigma factor (sigma-70 family)